MSIPNEITPRPVNALSVFGEVVSVGETMVFQQFLGIIDIDAPSSITVCKIIFSQEIIEI